MKYNDAWFGMLSKSAVSGLSDYYQKSESLLEADRKRDLSKKQEDVGKMGVIPNWHFDCLKSEECYILVVTMVEEPNMAGELKIIEEVIAQHRVIRLNLQGVQGSLTDFDALFSLQRAQAGWTHSSVVELIGQRQQLRDAIERVQNGLNKHFSWEEKALMPLFGEVFMKALLFEHTEIRQHIEQTISMIDNSNLEGMSQRDLLVYKSRLETSITKANQMVEEHANLEEQMLRMLRKTFQHEAKSPRPDES
jgi:hypothetical protein